MASPSAWANDDPAEDEDPAAAMARALQDPLASVKMLATDNTIAFNSGLEESDVNYNFQFQPVYSIPTSEESRFNYVARAVIPIVGLEPAVVEPPLGPAPTPRDSSTWGLSDTTLQFFISPKSKGAWKWGIGPQVSLRTHTNERAAGPGWGAGVAGILVGGVGPVSIATIALYHAGTEDDFESFAVQPMLFYNFESVPGLVVGYNNMITYNVKARSGNKWNVPLGVTISRTFAFESGDGLDLGIGYYYVVERPNAAPDSQIKFAITWIFG